MRPTKPLTRANTGAEFGVGPGLHSSKIPRIFGAFGVGTAHAYPGVMQHSKKASFVVSAIALASTLSGCGALTREEAQQALDEVKVDTQAQALTSESIEVGTNFSIGAAVKDAAAELETFLTNELPCATVSADADSSSATLTIDWGSKGNACSYKGRQWTGHQTLSISKDEDDRVIVDHVWDNLSDGKLSVDGTATVEWDKKNATRHVTHDAKWTRLSDGRTGEGSGDRTQTALDGGILEGFRTDGSRHWHGQRGDWDLQIDGVEVRWVDPVPQAGKYTLDTPFDKTIEASFERTGPKTIHVTLSGPRRSFDFNVATTSDDGETTKESDASAADDSNE